MHHRVPQFAWTILAFLVGARGIALGQTPNAWAWGDNTYGQLGNGSTAYSNVPVNVSTLTGVVGVAGGGDTSLALTIGGTVWGWGYNSDGELGNGSTYRSNVPVEVSGLTGVVAIAGGSVHNLALKRDGTVWAWGSNFYYGELGNGGNPQSYKSDSSVPVEVSGLTDVVAIAGGGYHSLALQSNGTVWAWGDNEYGELGNGSAASNSNVPVEVSGLTGVVGIAGGQYHSLALKSDGTVWAWGLNQYGQLGNGGVANANVPVEVSHLAGVVAIAGGAYHSLALRNDGMVWAWGDDTYGALGNGSSVNSEEPWSNVPVLVSGLTGVVAIAAGGLNGTSMALRNDGTAWAWGYNYEGQLGNESNVNSKVPVEVSGLTGVAAIAVGGYNSLAAAGGSLPYLAVTPASLSFAATGNQTITITDGGAAPLTIQQITLIGVNPGDFSTSGTCSPASLSPTQTCTLTVTFAPTAPGTRTAAVLLTANAPGSPIPIWLSGSGAPGPPPPTISAVVSASAFGGFSSVAPGSWIEIYGSNLAPNTREWAGTDFTGNNAPTSLDGVEVTIGGQKAFIDYISSAANGQINAQLPSNIATGGPLQLTVNNGTTTSGAYNIMVNATEAGLLAPTTFQIGGNQYVVAQHKDGSYVLPAGAIAGVNSSPAQPGETVLIYGVGFGPATPNIPAGGIVTEDNQLSLPFQMMFGQTPAQFKYDGLAPNYVGLYQFDVVVPTVSDNDLVPLTFTLGGSAGTQKLFTAVHQ